MPRFGLSYSCSPVQLSVGKECCLRSLVQGAKASPIPRMRQTQWEIAYDRKE
jgi:hypothetical protein